jgi:hypothetical protein
VPTQQPNTQSQLTRTHFSLAKERANSILLNTFF